MSDQRFSYGGQAVIEGVMMRGRHQATVAVRRFNGEIVCKHFTLDAVRRARWERLPLVRGLIVLWDMLGLGTKALNFSASVVSDEEEANSSVGSVLSLLLAVSFAIGLFFVVPHLLASLTSHLGASVFLRELSETFIRVAVILAYVGIIGRIPEIQRVFAYHGAEHKVVNAYEAGAPLDVDNVRSFGLIHPRCGTSFLVVVVLISFVLFFFVGHLPVWVRLLSRVALVPVIAAMAYEVLRVSATYYRYPLVRMLIAPSLIFQRLTTREPDDAMLETACTALQAVLEADGIDVDRNTQNRESVPAVSHVTC